jgi:hypothetical protein
MEKLLDVHAPARMTDGKVHWRMAAGAESISVSVTEAALHALGPRPVRDHVEVFETHRAALCDLAALKYARLHALDIELDHDDVAPLLNAGALPL